LIIILSEIIISQILAKYQGRGVLSERPTGAFSGKISDFGANIDSPCY
jgi:hypothetical protein